MSVTMLKFTGQVPPDSVLERALLGSTALSVATAIFDVKTPYVAVMRFKLDEFKQGSLKAVQAMMNSGKDKDMLLFFDNPENIDDKASWQPYELLTNAEKKPYLVATLENVPDLAEGKEYLGRKILKLFEKQCGYDLKKLVEELHDGDTASEIGSLNDGNGVITLQPAFKETLHYARPGTGIDAEWGWMTGPAQDDAVKEVVVEEPKKADPPRELTFEEQMAAAATGEFPSPDTQPQPEVPKKDDPKPDQTHKTDVARQPVNRTAAPGRSTAPTAKPTDAKNTVLAAGTDNETEYVPKRGMRHTDVLKAMMSEGMSPPKGWEAMYDKGTLKITRKVSLKNLDKHLNETTTASTVKAAAKQPELVKDAGKSDLPSAPAKVQPVLTADQRKNVEDNFLKKGVVVALMDKDGIDIFDPALLKDREEKLPSFALQLGLPSLAATYHWTPDNRCKLAALEPDAVAHLATWLTYRLIDVEKENARLKGKAPKTDSALTETPARTASPTRSTRGRAVA